MKKVCLIVGNTLPIPSVMGGAVEELVTILLEQNEIQHQVDLTIFSRKNDKAENIAKKYRHSRVIYIEDDTVLDKINNRIRRYLGKLLKPGFLLDVGYYRKIYSKLKKMQADVIVAEGGFYHELRRFAHKFGKENTYLHIHHHVIAEKEYDGIYGNIIAVSKFAQNEWIKSTAEPNISSYVVYNCVNEDKFKKRITVEQRNELRKQLNMKTDDFVVLYCGRIQEVKGVRELLKAFANIENEKMKLLIIGNADFGVDTQTPFLKEVSELVEEDKERIRFTGYIENEKLYQYYQCADLQVVPSMWEEAAGLVAIEGMLSGLPLIVTKSGGLVEYAPEDVAVQVERENIVVDLEKAIVSLYENPLKRREMSEASLKHAEKYTKTGFYKNYFEVFDKR